MYGINVKDKNFTDREIKISYNPLTREFAVWSQAYERDSEWISRISDVFLAKEDNSISSLRRHFIKEVNEGRTKKGIELLTDEEEDLIEDSKELVNKMKQNDENQILIYEAMTNTF